MIIMFLHYSLELECVVPITLDVKASDAFCSLLQVSKWLGGKTFKLFHYGSAFCKQSIEFAKVIIT